MAKALSLNTLNYLFIICLASMLKVACGTARKRALSINLPVTRQMPYVLFSMRIIAFSSFFIIKSLNSVSSESEYHIVGPVSSLLCESNTDLVKSGLYLTALVVEVLGMTTFVGFGGSFLGAGGKGLIAGLTS